MTNHKVLQFVQGRGAPLGIDAPFTARPMCLQT